MNEQLIQFPRKLEKNRGLNEARTQDRAIGRLLLYQLSYQSYRVLSKIPRDPVIRRVDSAILRLNHYLLDNSIGFAGVYPVDSVIHQLNTAHQWLSWLSTGLSCGRS